MKLQLDLKRKEMDSNKNTPVLSSAEKARLRKQRSRQKRSIEKKELDKVKDAKNARNRRRIKSANGYYIRGGNKGSRKYILHGFGKRKRNQYTEEGEFSYDDLVHGKITYEDGYTEEGDFDFHNGAIVKGKVTYQDGSSDEGSLLKSKNYSFNYLCTKESLKILNCMELERGLLKNTLRKVIFTMVF